MLLSIRSSKEQKAFQPKYNRRLRSSLISTPPGIGLLILGSRQRQSAAPGEAQRVRNKVSLWRVQLDAVYRSPPDVSVTGLVYHLELYPVIRRGRVKLVCIDQVIQRRVVILISTINGRRKAPPGAYAGFPAALVLVRRVDI